MKDNNNNYSIKDYFKGKNVFITGGSGFIGKALIEKLLRSCPDIGKIYILLRPKKGKELYERVEQIVSSPLFHPLTSKNPDSLKKIIPIKGDTSQLELGISIEDKTVLREEIHAFFNVAASVKFDDFLNDSIMVNLRSAREAALLALEMKNIEVFLHVSSTYCNIDNRKFIEEVLYPPHGDWREAILVAEHSDKDKFAILSQKYIGEFPNTYTFTKRLAEHCINDLVVGKIPTVICRPSVVIGTIEEPFQGWIDNFNGPVGLLVAGASALLRIVYADPEIITDYNAVDNTVKCMIVAAWHKANFGDINELSIYHQSNNDATPFKLGGLIENGKKLYWDVPFERKIWFPRNKATTSFYEYYINVILFHMIPAIILDLALRAARYPPILVKIQRKIYIANTAICHFMLNEWTFDNKNAFTLFEALPPKEKKDFNFLIFPTSDLCIYNYYLQSAVYCRAHLLNENKEITNANMTRTRRMYYLDVTVKIIFFVLVAWLFFIEINVPAKLWNVTYDYWSSL